MKYKEVELSDIFDFPSINGVNEKFIHNNKGNIPVYGGRKDGQPKGYIKDNIKNIKYFENSLSWNRNGSIGYVFVRESRFTTTDDHRPLYIKDRYKNELSMSFLRFKLQNGIISNGFAWDDKAGKDKMKMINISIPIKADGNFDLEAQKRIAKRYERIENFKQKIKEYYQTLKTCNVTIEEDKNIRYKEVEIKDIFDFIKGNSLYTHKYFLNNKGIFPVYSGATKNNGLIANINSFDFDTEDELWLTWTTDGVYAGTVFIRKEKFSMNTHCGLLKPKKYIYNNFDIYYIYHILNLILPNNAIGEQNKRVTKNIIENISIPIPIKNDDSFDLEAQKCIAKRYGCIEMKRSKTMEYLKQIIDTQVRIEL